MHLEQSHNQNTNLNSTRQITPWPKVPINFHRIPDHGSFIAQQACNLPNTLWQQPCSGTRYEGRPTLKISSTCCNSLRRLRCSKKPSNGLYCRANESTFTLRPCSFKIYLNTWWSKSLCAPDDYSTKNTQKYSILNRIHSECGPCYTEHGLREHSSACQ